MNKIIKYLLAILGGINIVYGIFAPVALSLLVVIVFRLTQFNQYILISVGIITAVYRALNFLRFKD